MNVTHLDVVVERLVQLLVDVHVAVEGLGGRDVEVLLRHLLQTAHDGLAGRLAEGQVVHDVGEVGHHGVEVVVGRARLDVEVTRNSAGSNTGTHATMQVQAQKTIYDKK